MGLVSSRFFNVCYEFLPVLDWGWGWARKWDWVLILWCFMYHMEHGLAGRD